MASVRGRDAPEILAIPHKALHSKFTLRVEQIECLLARLRPMINLGLHLQPLFIGLPKATPQQKQALQQR